MQIHELNNYSGDLDSNAYLAVDDGADTGKVSVTGLLADTNADISALDTSLNARIDNIISPSGTAPNPDEIIDARYGADGVTYTNLGTAIRTQVTDLKSDFDGFVNECNILPAQDILENTVPQLSTANLVSSNHFDCTDYVPIKSNWRSITAQNHVHLTNGNNFYFGRIAITFWDENKTLIAYSDNDTSSETITTVVPKNATYVIVALSRYASDSRYMKITEKSAYRMQSFVSETELLQLNQAGSYMLTSSVLANITDAPSGASGDYLVSVSTFDNGYFQEMISLSHADEHHVRFILNSSGAGTWYSWKWSNYTSTLFYTRGYFSGTSLASKSIAGYYLLVSSMISDLTDAPDGLSGDYVLVVYPFGNGYAQELISLVRPDERHIRYILNSSGTGTWNSIRRDSIKIATFGDSITRGQIGGTSPAQYTDSGFVRASISKGYSVDNYGIGGIGYSYTVNGHNALNEINNADLTDVDIVTLSFGVNDWQNNMPVGSVDDNTIDTMCGGMNLAIAKVIEKAPTASIIIFSPLNCTFEGGTASGKWALGQSLPTSGTLEDVFMAMKAVCDKHEIAFVDMTHNNPAVNCLNADDTNVLGDGLHPTVSTYKHLGRVIANYI